MNASGRQTELREAIDRLGGDLNRWPDAALANEVRVAALADRQLRAWLDGENALERGLARVRQALDNEIAASGAIERIRAAVTLEQTPRQRRGRWIAVAAAMVVAAGLGSFIDLAVLGADDSRFEVVVVDPLVFGTTGAEVQ